MRKGLSGTLQVRMRLQVWGRGEERTWRGEQRYARGGQKESHGTNFLILSGSFYSTSGSSISSGRLTGGYSQEGHETKSEGLSLKSHCKGAVETMGEEDTISDAVSSFSGETGRQSTRTTGTGCHFSTLEQRGIAVPSAMARDPQGGKDVVKVAKAAICKSASEDDTPSAGAAKGEEKKNGGADPRTASMVVRCQQSFHQNPPPPPPSPSPLGGTGR